MTSHTPPQPWVDLIDGLRILATHAVNDISPLHCEHDTLTVMADPTQFSQDELDRLDVLGFLPDTDNGTFHSYRFGSA